ncbi:MAG: hypothetical protein J7598_13330 [Mitsuaria chitosanitabida]|jgi:hypothetical protein|uniref:hypothetical protein n=1 Tax=Roseateles chitosanitabidus TaxID=65048 RepID=UPI001B2CA422|nr:hypothetical protein [Roseateles chitosanitabidus]MBO9687583.1 hypothetical protein [Roseateles chitosanitabidus]
MRRWLTLFLLVLMPLQFTWGAAAVYCQHEPAPETRHFGHHTHQHGDAGHPGPQADGAKPADPTGSSVDAKKLTDLKKVADSDKSKPGKLAPDNDCGQCHHSAFKPVAAVAAALNDIGGQVQQGLAEPAFSSRSPDHPDRPNWRIA